MLFQEHILPGMWLAIDYELNVLSFYGTTGRIKHRTSIRIRISVFSSENEWHGQQAETIQIKEVNQHELKSWLNIRFTKYQSSLDILHSQDFFSSTNRIVVHVVLFSCKLRFCCIFWLLAQEGCVICWNTVSALLSRYTQPSMCPSTERFRAEQMLTLLLVILFF